MDSQNLKLLILRRVQTTQTRSEHSDKMTARNNALAKEMARDHEAVTAREKELIEFGMRLQRSIDDNWLTVGALPGESAYSAKNYKDDKFSEGENGGGWEEQVPLVLALLEMIEEPVSLPVVSEEATYKRTPDVPELEEDIPISSSDEEEEEEDPITHSLEWFKENRPEQYDIAERVVDQIEEHPEQKNIVIKAEEKTGKREMVEIISLLTRMGKKNSYFTAFNAKSIDVQVEEIKRYGVTAVKCNSVDRMTKEVEGIEPDSIAHVDELDYASGKEQSLAPLIAAKDFTKIFYSATTHELEKEMKVGDYKLFTFAPNENYRGSKWFLENGLVHESKPFVSDDDDVLEITEHGQELIQMLTDEKPVGIVRLTKAGFHKSMKEKFELGEDGSCTHEGIRFSFVDSEIKEVFNPAEIGRVNKKTIIFLLQSWRRSTELKGHGKICFMHDDRRIASKKRSGVSYASLSQAVSRIKHYDTSGHKIKVYTDKKAFQISCGLISEEEHKLYNRQGYSETNKAGSGYAN